MQKRIDYVKQYYLHLQREIALKITQLDVNDDSSVNNAIDNIVRER